MCILVLTLVVKTFFYLRIFPSLTPIVVMITEVVYDLRIFLMFYLILIGAFCNIFAVLGLGNYTGDGKIDRSSSGKEYESIGLHIGEFFWTFKISLGDFSAITPSKSLNKAENIIFWITWVLCVLITCIIFLNFVVAEACASYGRIKESLEQVKM